MPPMKGCAARRGGRLGSSEWQTNLPSELCFLRQFPPICLSNDDGSVRPSSAHRVDWGADCLALVEGNLFTQENESCEVDSICGQYLFNSRNLRRHRCGRNRRV